MAVKVERGKNWFILLEQTYNHYETPSLFHESLITTCNKETFLPNFDDMFLFHYIHSIVFSVSKYSTIYWYVAHHKWI